MPVKSGYSYFKEVTVNHTDDGAQTNYQMKVLVGESSGATGEEVDCGGHCLSTFNDLWFQGYDADGVTVIDLDYWIESISGTTPNQLATVWVEVAYVPAHPDNTTVWMSYGKAGASAASDGDNTFLFFDHFDGDLSKWQGATDHCAVASSAVTLTSPDATTWNHVYGTTAVSGNVRFRGRVYYYSGLAAEYSYCGLGADFAAPYFDAVMVFKSSAVNRWDTQTDATNTYSTSAIGADAYHIYDHARLLSGTDTGRGFYDSVQVGSDQTLKISTLDMYAAFGGYKNAATNITIKLDWCFLSNYTYNEPTWGTWGAEQAIPNIKQFYYPHILAH